MPRTAKTEDLTYEPPETLGLLARPEDQELDEKLVSANAVGVLSTAIKASAFWFDLEDQITLTTAETLTVSDADSYARGFDLLKELTSLEDRIVAWYSRFDRPLGFLVKVVQSLRIPQTKQVDTTKKALSKRLGTWKAEQEARDRAEAAKRQAAADLAAKQAQAAKAAALKAVAQAQEDASLAAALNKEAEAVLAVDVKALPVETKSSVPVVPGGHTRQTWTCAFDDLKALMTAYVEGKCVIPDADLINDLQGFMDKMATKLETKLGQQYPGTRAVCISGAVARRDR